MEVTVLNSTDNPERLVCQAARGDYFEGYVGDTDYAELMEPIEHSDDDLAKLEAKTAAFIEKQLDRGHYGPFEHPQITFAVKGVSRVTMAQITRHRHLTFDVQSQRYVDFSDTEAILPRSLEDPEHFARETGTVDVDQREYHKEMYEGLADSAMEAYKSMVEDGVPKEDARFLLPVGMPVNMTFSGNARSFMHVFNMRRKADSQWEIRELSDMLAEELKDWMPYTFNWYENNMPHKIGP